VSTDSTRASASASPSDTAKEVGRLDQASPPSNNAVADQSTHLNTAPEPAPFAILLSPWLWLGLAVAFGAVSFVVGRRLRST
jgi:hypothetical protein